MPRLTRSRAKVDVQASGSDAEMDIVEEDPIQDDDEPENADEEEEEEEEEEDEDKEDELEDDEEGEGSDSDAASPPAAQASGLTASELRTRIKIKLKVLDRLTGGSRRTSTATATPTPEASSRRRQSRREIDVESEDEDSDEDGSMRSTSVATPGRPLTARQAVLRNVVDSSHVSLIEPPNPRKKKPLTEIELALKREETARKRRNLSEKKLQDEKTETINRLLKKQSRTRGRRNALSTAEDRPAPAASIPGADIEEDLVEEGSSTPVLPTMYRWISTTRTSGAEEDTERKMVLSFSVPISAAQVPSTPELQTTMDVDQSGKQPPIPSPVTPVCDVAGCSSQRKYRLVKDFHRGACGLVHLKHLEAQLTSL